jgi:hypothetical protein
MKTGDKVKVVDPSDFIAKEFDGQEGIITFIAQAYAWPIEVKFSTDGLSVCFKRDELKVIDNV